MKEPKIKLGLKNDKVEIFWEAITFRLVGRKD